MIFVTVGTTPFESLIKEVDAVSRQIKEKIVCQIADGEYIPDNCQFFRYKPSLDQEINRADLIICHGGAGTLFKLLKLNKKIISVPNLERKDKHQTDLIGSLAEGNFIIPCYELSELKLKILDSKTIVLPKYESPECRIAEEIAKFIG
jgi:beta-1,4-N-acetylglucosaminyltransferase